MMQPQMMMQSQMMGMHGMAPMMQPMMQPVAAVQPQPPAAPAAPIKPKGVKLKNAVLARKPKAGEEEDAAPGSAQPSPAAVVRSPAEPAKPPISLKPADGVFNRMLMLRIWQVHKDKVHPQVQGLTVNTRTDKAGTPGPAGNRKPQRVREEEGFLTRNKSGGGGKGNRPLDPMMQR